MEFKDYYAVLGIEPTADDKTIKTAFRKLARLYHPDVSKQPDAEIKFKEVAEAYEVLHSSEKRAEYDVLRESRNRGQGFGSHNGQADAGFNTGSDPQADQDFSDFFNSIFGPARSRNSGFHGFRDSHHEDVNRHKGRDVEMEYPVMLEDTISDTTKPIEFTIPYTDMQGHSHELKKSLNVKIPAGVSDGERIRLKGQGAPGIGNNSASGDLYLHIRLVPHPLFDIEGHNLIITLPLAPWEAALGTKITLPTLSGKISLSIPANSQSGQRLRIKGKGLMSKNGRNDLFAVLKIVIPQTANEDVKKLWSQLADKASFDPRAEWSY